MTDLLSHMYAFKRDRKAEWIRRACTEKGLSKKDANCMSMQDLSELLNESYIPLRTLPKPSHRRPLPVRKWIVPQEFKIFIVMSKPFQKLYTEWEEQYESLFEEDRDLFYENLESAYNQSTKCPKWKWIQKYCSTHPDEQIIVFMAPEKWRTIAPTSIVQGINKMDVLLHPNTRSWKRALRDFESGETKVLIVACDDPPFEELPDCTWIHMGVDSKHKRCASKHFYLNVIKPEEKSEENEVVFQQVTKPSLDAYKLLMQDDDEENEC